MSSSPVILIGDAINSARKQIRAACVETLVEALPLAAPGTVLVVSAASFDLPEFRNVINGVLTDTRIIVVLPGGDNGIEYLLAGCSGVIHDGVTTQELQRAIDRVASGEVWASRKLTGLAFHELSARTREQVLTPTEQKVVALARAGLSNQQIANQLYIERETVRWHLRSIYQKVGASSIPGRRRPAASAN
jgi:DNA-binding NarL/FixJ family response regulator